MSLMDRLKTSWNAFLGRDPTEDLYGLGPGYSIRPDRVRMSRGNERSIVTAIYNRIALDAASIDIEHVKLDNNGKYLSTINDSFNDCLTLQANKDQTARAFMQDVIISMFDEGAVAIVPVDTLGNPKKTDSYKILSLRVGRITQWYPNDVRVELYNDRVGRKEELVFPKSMVAIVENPFYAVMNEPNSTVRRLVHKLSILDAIDEQTGAGKLNMIIQLPYIIKTEGRRRQAENRRTEMEKQLSSSQYGIAYSDGTEHITQLNRPLDNNLLTQIEYLQKVFYSQLGITEEIMNGTAKDEVMQNYYTRTVEPIVSAIVIAMKCKFLSQTARSQRQSIMFFRDPFKLMPVSAAAEMADKFTRNMIMTANEIRQVIGMKPSQDPGANQLKNANINQSNIDVANQQNIPTDANDLNANQKNSSFSNLMNSSTSKY